MPRVFDVVPLLDVDNVVRALIRQLQDMGTASLYCPRQAPGRGVVACTYEQWFSPFSFCRRYCQLPSSGGACSVSYSLGWVVMACRLLLAVGLELLILIGPTGPARAATVVPLVMRGTWFLSALP